MEFSSENDAGVQFEVWSFLLKTKFTINFCFNPKLI